MGCRQIPRRLGTNFGVRDDAHVSQAKNALRIVKAEAGHVKSEVERQIDRMLQVQGRATRSC